MKGPLLPLGELKGDSGRRVLVLDGGIGWGALAAVRSLGAAGFETHLGFPLGIPLRNAASRYCAGHVVYPDPSYAPEEFQDWLVSAASEYAAVFPVKEPSLLATARIKDRLAAAGTLVPIAEPAVLETATRKVDVLHLARRRGLRLPRTVVTSELPSAAELARLVGYPFVMKTSSEGDLPPALRHFLVSAPDLARTREQFDELAQGGPVILQEFIEGIGIGVALIYSDAGRVTAISGHRRIFEQFRDGGPSIVARTEVHPDALSQARRLLDALGWKGIAMVEFRLRPDGQAVFMEVNPRVWGTMSLAIASGVDFPRLLLETFRGPEPSSPHLPLRKRRYLSFEALATALLAPKEKRPYLGAFAVALARSASGLSIKELQGFDLRPQFEEALHRIRSQGTRQRPSHVAGVRFGPVLDPPTLVRLGIRTTLDLRAPDEVARGPELPVESVRRISFPIPDDTGLPPDRFIDLTDRIAEAARPGPLYVHCRQGKGRAPMAVTGYLVRQGLPVEEAFATVYAERPSALLNGVQRDAVFRLARLLRSPPWTAPRPFPA